MTKLTSGGRRAATAWQMLALERYLTWIGPLSFGYAGLTVALRRSLRAAFTALLLVNPRLALIGGETADTSASARVLRAGVTVVGTLPERTLARPDVRWSPVRACWLTASSWPGWSRWSRPSRRAWR